MQWVDHVQSHKDKESVLWICAPRVWRNEAAVCWYGVWSMDNVLSSSTGSCTWALALALAAVVGGVILRRASDRWWSTRTARPD